MGEKRRDYVLLWVTPPYTHARAHTRTCIHTHVHMYTRSGQDSGRITYLPGRRGCHRGARCSVVRLGELSVGLGLTPDSAVCLCWLCSGWSRVVVVADGTEMRGEGTPGSPGAQQAGQRGEGHRSSWG